MGEKKIAIINSVCGTGSTGRLCVDLSNYFEKNGIKTLICFGRNENNYYSHNSYCFSNRFEVFLHGLRARLFDESGFGSTRPTKKLIKKLELFQPDIIVLNNLHGYYLNIDLFLNWLANSGIKTIAVFHDCWNFTGHCAHFESKCCLKWKTGCGKCPAKKDYPRSILFDKSRSNYIRKKELFGRISNLTIVSPSKWLDGILGESFFSKTNRIVINNGIDISTFKKHKSDFIKDNHLINKRIILCIANIFDEKKGINDILLLSKKLGKDEIIVLVGKVKIRKAKLDKNIIHIDRTDSIQTLVDIYSSSDVLFNPTYEDTFPTTNLEALSCELPIICYKTGGATETVDPNFVVEKGDVSKAYYLMQKLFNKEIEYKFSSTNNFSMDIMHNRYLDLINK